MSSAIMSSDMTPPSFDPPQGEYSLSTVPDPRTENSTPSRGSGTATPSRHPDLSSEVAALSEKLVNSINLQTDLDDSLSATRHELDVALGRIKELDAIISSQRETLSGDVWIRRSSVEPEKEALRQRIREEQKQRTAVEAERDQMRNELDTLATALVAEAQQLVVTEREQARARQDQLNQKNEQLKNQLADTEDMLRAQQVQLVEMRQTIDHMSEHDIHSNPTCPSSPGLSRGTRETRDDDASVNETLPELPPAMPPLSYPHLLQPVMRTDIPLYMEFCSFAKLSRGVRKRTSQGMYSGLASLGLGLGGNPYSLSHYNSSTSSLPTPPPSAANSNPQSPNTPAPPVSAGPQLSAQTTPLSNTSLYKRVWAEDVEPALRTESMSWLQRRGLTNAISDGSLIIEPVLIDTPFANISKPHHYPCTLCGEVRKAKEFLRTHRYRISESESAQKNPLCKFCLFRIRSCCELMSFLRMVKDGHWKMDDTDSIRTAWDECTRLREQIFWSRIGGGVIPAPERRPSHATVASSRVSQESAASLHLPEPEKDVVEEDVHVAPQAHVEVEVAAEAAAEAKEMTAVVTETETTSVGSAVAFPEVTVDVPGAPEEAEKQQRPQQLSTPKAVLRERSHSAMNASSLPTPATDDTIKRLSLTIPITGTTTMFQ